MGTFVIYLLHGVPHVGKVVGEAKTKLRVRDLSGKESLLPKGRAVVMRDDPSSLEDIDDSSRVMDPVDLELLHEASLAEDKERFTVEELSSIYFGNQPSMAEVFSMFKALCSDKLYFKRWKDFTFSPRPHSEIELIKEEERRRAEEEERVEKAVGLLRKGEGNGERSSVLELIRLFVENPDVVSEKDTAFLEKVLGRLGKDPRKVAVDILKREGILKDPFSEVLYIRGVKTNFPQRVEVFSKGVRDSFRVDPSGREDLRDLFTFTIDDEDTKEVDDGLSYERQGNTDVVYVHISDLTPIVERDDPVDREAFRRGSSIYAPDAVYPMIPAPISFDTGSLVQGKERYALTFRFVVKDGTVLEYSIMPSVVLVRKRLSYDDADRMISEGSDQFSEILRRLLELAQSLKRSREKRGGFFLPRRDIKVMVGKDGELRIKVIDPLSPSRFMVSEFMVLYNYIASKFSLENSIPVIYRSQPPPDDGLNFSLEKMTYQDELPLEILRDIFSRVKPSRLSLSPSSHWGLGLDSYIQVTSPIRRYSDLALQRQIVSFVTKGKPAYEEMDLMKVIALSEDGTKEIKALEREMNNMAINMFFAGLKGVVDGVVRDRTNKGYLVSPMGLPIRLPLVSQRNLEFGDRIKIRPRSSGNGSVVFEDVGDAD